MPDTADWDRWYDNFIGFAIVAAIGIMILNIILLIVHVIFGV